jgi:hypothetical protein
MLCKIFEFLIIHYNNLAYAFFETRNEMTTINYKMKDFLDKIERKRDRAAIRHGQLCEAVRKHDGKLCDAYKVKGTKFCQAHRRLNSKGENHLFASEYTDDASVRENHSPEYFEFDNIKNNHKNDEILEDILNALDLY